MTYGITAVFYKNYQAMKVKDANGKRKYKYIINTGSSRSSKTFSLIELLHQICENNDNFRVTAWRDTKLNVAWEHKLFTSIEKIKLGLGNRRTERNKEFLLNYSIGEINIGQMPDAQVANDISIKYSAVITNRYEYDSLTKVYKRFVNGVEHKDYITGNQYTFKNIIVVQVGNYAIDNYGRQEIDNIGEYRGYYITNGYAVPIIAKKESRSSQTIYQYLDGTEITVNDGNTFIQIQPKNQPLLMS